MVSPKTYSSRHRTPITAPFECSVVLNRTKRPLSIGDCCNRESAQTLQRRTCCRISVSPAVTSTSNVEVANSSTPFQYLVKYLFKYVKQ
jgi:hypothetical protein